MKTGADQRLRSANYVVRIHHHSQRFFSAHCPQTWQFMSIYAQFLLQHRVSEALYISMYDLVYRVYLFINHLLSIITHNNVFIFSFESMHCLEPLHYCYSAQCYYLMHSYPLLMIITSIFMRKACNCMTCIMVIACIIICYDVQCFRISIPC